jgi:bacterial/archaeal transporter family-2 protein
MTFYFLIPVALGMAIVTQGILNQKISSSWSLVPTILLNSTVAFAASAFLFVLARILPTGWPEILRIQSQGGFSSKWWYLIPGLCGFLIVLGVPWSIQTLRPSKTFICMIAAQVLFSLLADHFLYESSVGFLKLIGAGLAVAGAVLVALN